MAQPIEAVISTANSVVQVSAAVGSAGQALPSTPSSSIKLATSSYGGPVQYKVDAGPWVTLDREQGIHLAIDLSVSTVLLRKATPVGSDVPVSLFVNTVANTAPINGVPLAAAAPITISGAPFVGSVLAASIAAGWQNTGGNWTRNGTAISGATSLTYTLVSADVPGPVTYKSSNIPYIPPGLTIAAPDAAPTITTAPALTGGGAVGQAITLTPGTVTGSPTPTSTFSWRSDSGAELSTSASAFTPVATGQITVVQTTVNSAGQVTRMSNTVVVSAASIVYDAIALGGQSNKVATNTGTPDTDARDANIFMLDCTITSGTYGQILSAVDPMSFPARQASNIGSSLPMARQYVSANPGKKVLLVPVAVGGTDQTKWDSTAADPGPLASTTPASIPTGGLFWNFRRQMQAAFAAAPGSTWVGTMWWQGESSNSLSGNAYGTFLDAFIAAIRAWPFTGASTSRFVIDQLGYEAIQLNGGAGANASNASYESVNIQLMDVSARNALTMLVPSIGAGYNVGDSLHTNAPGQRLLGPMEHTALAAAAARTTAAAAGSVSGVQALVPSDTGAYINWLPPYDGGVVNDYLLEYSSNGGTTWTAYTRAASTHCADTLTGLAPGTTYIPAVTAKGPGGSGPRVVGASFTTAAAFSLAPVQLTGLTGVTQSANATDGTYFDYAAVNGATSASNHAGVSTRKIAASTDGAFSAVMGPGSTAGNYMPITARNTNVDAAVSTGFGVATSSQTALALRKVATNLMATEGGGVFRTRRCGARWVAEYAPAASPTAFKVVFLYLAGDTDAGDAFFGIGFFLTGGGRSWQKLTGYNTVVV